MALLTKQGNVFATHTSAEGGTWWTPREDTAAGRAWVKRADLGGDQETGFEQAFSSLSWSFVKDKAPRLMDYCVGFQLVDRDEDNTKAFAVLGFKIGKQWMYVPVFFLNGKVKGHELLYLKQQDMFVPLKENWVNYILGRRPHVLGEGSQKDVFQLGGMSPNIDRLSVPPSQNKYGSDVSAYGVPKPYECPKCGGDAYAGEVTADHREYTTKFRGGGKCVDCGHSFSIVGPGLRPRGEKSGADLGNGIRVDAWALDALPMCAAMMTKSASFLFEGQPGALSTAGLVAAPMKAACALFPHTLEDVLSAVPGTAQIARGWAGRYPGFKLACDKFYGPGLFDRAEAACKEAVDSLLASPPPADPADCPSLLGHLEKDAAGDDKVDILTSADVAKRVNIKDEERRTVQSNGYLVKDEREPDEITLVYNTQLPQTLVTPDTTGIFDVLEKPGKFSRMLVVSAPTTLQGNAEFVTVVRVGDGKQPWVNVHRLRIYARPRPETGDVDSREEYREWFDGLPDKRLSKGGTFVAVNVRGFGTVPFEVLEVYDDGADNGVATYKVKFLDRTDANRGRPPWGPRTRMDPEFDDLKLGSPESNEDCLRENALLVINKRRGSVARSLGTELRLPDEGTKFLAVKPAAEPEEDDDEKPECECGDEKEDKEGPSYENEECFGEGGSEEPRPIILGDLLDMQMFMTEKTSGLKLLGDSHEVLISGEKRGSDRMSYGQALFHLIRVHGTSEPAAREMLKQAQAKAAGHAPVAFRLLYAPSYPAEKSADSYGGPSSPPFPPPSYGTEQMGYNSVRAQYPQEEEQPVPELASGRTDPRIYDPFLRITPDSTAMSAAQQAGSEGQKEVFDVSSIASLLKSTRQDRRIDDYLGSLMRALSNIGKLLALSYYHAEEWQERYSKGTVPELQDSLRNTFESLGDLTLELRCRETDPDFDSAVGPDISQTAEN